MKYSPDSIICRKRTGASEGSCPYYKFTHVIRIADWPLTQSYPRINGLNGNRFPCSIGVAIKSGDVGGLTAIGSV